MDPAKDILVVFLTSHGSPDGLDVVAGHRREKLSPRALRSAAWPLCARAQQSMLVIGYVGPEAPGLFASRVKAFVDGLAETGHLTEEPTFIVASSHGGRPVLVRFCRL
jgi:hypothetical protein